MHRVSISESGALVCAAKRSKPDELNEKRIYNRNYVTNEEAKTSRDVGECPHPRLTEKYYGALLFERSRFVFAAVGQCTA